MRRVFVAVSAATTMAIALTGCGNDAANSEPIEGSERTEGSGQTEASSTGCDLEGQSIELIVPYSPGGGYDQYARTLAPALGDELRANVVVVNQPGAGGLLATNQLLNAEPDGTTMAILNMTGHVGSALGGAEGVQYDPRDFGYIGRISSEPDVVLTSASGPYDTFEDLAKFAESSPVTFAATGPGANDYVDALMLESVLGLDADPVTGFEGGGEASLAMLQGNVDAHSRSLYSQLPVVEAGDAHAVLIMGSQPSDELPDTPVVVDFAENEHQRELLEFHSSLIESGRAFATPPGIEADCLTEMRKAYESVVTQEGFMAESANSGRPISFASGEDVEQTVDKLMDAPQAYVDILKEAYSEAR
jgi:tripartite-type tricarboxylate transporter receptor subunit TctC